MLIGHTFVYMMNSEPFKERQREKSNQKKQKQKTTKNSITSITFFSVLPIIKTRLINIQVLKFNKHNYTKGSPEHHFIFQSGSYAGLP